MYCSLIRLLVVLLQIVYKNGTLNHAFAESILTRKDAKGYARARSACVCGEIYYACCGVSFSIEASSPFLALSRALLPCISSLTHTHSLTHPIQTHNSPSIPI